MKEFRERVLIPLLIPLGALAIIAVVVLNISRVLLALEERSGPHTVVAVAIIIASSVLFGCTYMSSRGEERSAGTMSLLSVAGIMVIIADAGKTLTGTWTAKPGTYSFYCDVPGHRQAGMETKVTVK